MTISNDVLTQIAIFILAASGFLVANYIYQKKRKQAYLVCPIKFDCNTVVNSDYSRFFGIPLEILGMIYYGIVAVAYLALILVPSFSLPYLDSFLFTISTIAFLFSAYLMGILAFVLRKGCSWCFLSAILSTLIFLLTALI